MFVERLSDEQIREFLNEQCKQESIKEYMWEIGRIEYSCKKIINVSLKKFYEGGNRYIGRASLEDFNAYTALSRRFKKNWLQYLYKIFGEEYKQAYIQECLSVFNED